MRATNKTIPTLVESRVNFVNSSRSLQGIVNPEPITEFGELDEQEIARFRIDQRTGISYLVLSYSTPIAWETKNGWVYKVTQKLNTISTRHLGMLYLFHKRG